MNSAKPAFPDDADSAFGVTRLLLLLGLLLCLSFPHVVFGSHAFVYRDAGVLSYPVAYYFRHCFQHGQLPLWNPYNNCGIPFLAQWNTLVLYPFSLIYLLLPLPWSMNYFMLAHLFLAGTGMYFLARRWFGNPFAATLAGLAFAWNGLTLSNLIWPTNTAALGWMPWVVLLVDKAVAQGGRALFWAALAGACQMMTGAPEPILFTWLILLPISAAHWSGNWQSAARIGLHFAAVAGLVAALSAAQLLPWLDFVAHSDRSSASGDARWSMPVWGAANFLVPLFRDNPSLEGVYWQPGQELFSSYYAGIVTLALALLAVLRRRDARTPLLAALALGGLLCAWGNAGHVLPLLRKLSPWLGFTRYPVKFIAITIFCLPLLAASAVAWLQTHPGPQGRRALWLSGGVIALGIVGVLLFSRHFPFPGEVWSVTWQSGWTRLVFLLAALWILSRRNAARTRSVRVLTGFGLLLLAGLDVSTHAPDQNPSAPVQAYDPVTPAMARLPELGQSRAMLSREADEWMNHLGNRSILELYLSQRMELFNDCNLLERIPTVGGFYPVYLLHASEVSRLLYGGPYLPHLAKFLGVAQLATTNELFKWQAQSNYMPMATIGQKPVFLEDAAILTALASADFQPREVVYLPVEARDKVSATADPQAKILSSAVTASSCKFATEAGHETMLVVAQSWYHCWRADIDGQTAPLLRANEAFQSLVVPAGRHTVRLIYKDAAFRNGAVISLFSLALCLAGAWRFPTGRV